MKETALARIRRFEIGDLEEILAIEAQAFPKTAYSRALFVDYANRLPETFVVIEKGTNIAGYMIFGEDGHIHSAAVKRPYRRQGLGRKLFTHALNCVKDRLWLEVRTRNRTAIAFYKSMGMKQTGKVPKYYGSDDALIFSI